MSNPYIEVIKDGHAEAVRDREKHKLGAGGCTFEHDFGSECVTCAALYDRVTVFDAILEEIAKRLKENPPPIVGFVEDGNGKLGLLPESCEAFASSDKTKLYHLVEMEEMGDSKERE